MRSALWLRVVDRAAPPERLAAFRIVLATFVVIYLVLRFPVFWALADKPATAFEPVGLLTWLDQPLPGWTLRATLLVALTSGVATALGWRYRLLAPVFAASVLLVTTYRSSWGQLLHFENLFVLQLLVISFTPAADAWSLDARSRGRTRDHTTYGFALQLACVCVVVTYVIAGIAKLRYGGFDWMLGDTLRNHLAYSATRLELLGGSGSPLAGLAVRNAWILPPMGVASVLIELAAPIALVSARGRWVWVASAWMMHVSIFALMLIGFPAPLFLVAFAPFFAIEQLPTRYQAWRAADRTRAAAAPVR